MVAGTTSRRTTVTSTIGATIIPVPIIFVKVTLETEERPDHDAEHQRRARHDSPRALQPGGGPSRHALSARLSAGDHDGVEQPRAFTSRSDPKPVVDPTLTSSLPIVSAKPAGPGRLEP